MSEQDALENDASILGLRSQVTVVKAEGEIPDPVVKGERELLRSNALTLDDGTANSFDQLGKGKIVPPTYDPFVLAALMQTNNTLLQCSSAMEVNIDGTGYELERADGEALTDDDKKKVENLKKFFDEVYPGESMVTLRRSLRRDLEGTGNAYIEVLRNEKGSITFLRRLDAKLMRLVALDDAVPVSRTVNRMGAETTIRMMVRERRYVMQVGSKFRFFKEFGASRDVHALTGEWAGAPNSAVQPLPSQNLQKSARRQKKELAKAEGRLSADVRGTEVIALGVIPDVTTPYSVPRWINQVPSVLGSRKAEEFNLEFFNSGGLPPAMILVQGGTLSAASRRDLTNYLSGKSKYKQRGVIAEVAPAGGSLDGSGGSVRVTVERFGDERQKDSMFGIYDERTAEHVRQAFRLPPLFLGKSQDQNFATAYASYMVAEAQVFRPEREEFDEIVNVKLMKELAPDYLFRSLPLQVNDVEQQLTALAMVKDLADPEEFLRTVNELASVTLTPRDNLGEDDAMNVVRQMLGRQALGNKLPNGEEVEEDPKVVEADEKGRIKKMDSGLLTELVEDWAAHLTGDKVFKASEVSAMTGLIGSLTPEVRGLFNQSVAQKMLKPQNDVSGTAALLAHAGECLNRGE